VGESKPSFWPQRLAGGLQAGVLAGLIMAGWLMLEGLRHDQTIWTNANLVSTVLAGRQGLRSTFGMHTVAGLALHLVVAGLHGLLLAVLLSPLVRPLWAVNASVLFSIASYWISFGWMIGQWAPMMASRASRPAWFGAHVLFGVMLGLYPDFARSLMPKVAPEPAPAEPAPVEAAPAEPAPTESVPGPEIARYEEK
jgi:hypothetical protein